MLGLKQGSREDLTPEQQDIEAEIGYAAQTILAYLLKLDKSLEKYYDSEPSFEWG
jgi:hypothetical protein